MPLAEKNCNQDFINILSFLNFKIVNVINFSEYNVNYIFKNLVLKVKGATNNVLRLLNKVFEDVIYIICKEIVIQI